MTPQGTWDWRDNMERRQDDRHKENSEALREIKKQLDPLVASMSNICGDGLHPGRLGLAEREIEIIRDLLTKLDKKMAIWGGVMGAFLVVIEVISRILGDIHK